MDNFNIGWYVIYTRPNHEKKVTERLAELDIGFFLPTIQMLRVWRDRRKFVSRPLFPSYVFVYLKTKENYFQGLETESALYYLKCGKTNARINENVINDIRLFINAGNEIEVSTAYFRPGQQLVVRSGPLTGLDCEVIQHDGKQKVLVRVRLLQRALLMSVTPESLMAI
jgi:transcriptional antiterminator RfaH